MDVNSMDNAYMSAEHAGRENRQSSLSAVKRAGGFEPEPLDLMDLFAFYMSRLPLLIAALLIGALAAGLITKFFIPDKFTATSRMYMVSASSDSVVNLTDLNIGTSLSNDYVELMQSRPVIEEVIKVLELDYSYEKLLKMVSLSVVSNTRIVKIAVTSTDPREAMQIANEIALTSRVQLPKVMEAPMPSIAEMAVLPTRRSSPSLSVNVAIGASALFLTAVIVLFAIYRTDDTIKTSEDLEKAFGVIPLSVIPEGRIEGLHKDRDAASEGTGHGRMRFGRRKRVRSKGAGV